MAEIDRDMATREEETKGEPRAAYNGPTVYYVGALHETPTKSLVRFMYKCKQINGRLPIRKSFTVHEYGSLGSARTAAEAFRAETSDRLNLTIRLHSCFTKQFSAEEKQYVAGMFDGDGCVMYSKDHGFRVMLAQTGPSLFIPPEIISFMKNIYGGAVDIQKPNPAPGHKYGWQYYLQNKHAQILLHHIADHGILKSEQAKLVLPYVEKLEIRRRITLSAEQSRTLSDRLKNCKQRYADVTILESRLTIPYLAGLMDAEGCLHVTKEGTLMVFIAQTSCPNLLAAIKQRLGYGTLNVSRSIDGEVRIFTMYGDAAVLFLRDIYPYSIVKRLQIKEVLDNIDFIRTKTKTKRKRLLGEPDRQIGIDKIRSSLTHLKHDIDGDKSVSGSESACSDA